MKGLALGLLCMLLFTGVQAQYIKQKGAVYRDTVPLFIQSAIFVQDFLPKRTFIAVSAKIKVFVAQWRDYRIQPVIIEQIERKAKNLDSVHLARTEFRVRFMNGSLSPWKSIAQNKVLLDTLLANKEKLVMEFRLIGHKELLQQTTIVHADWLPVVTAFRTKNSTDTFNNEVTAKSVFDDRHLPKGFTRLNGNNLKIAAGKELELALTNHSLNQDSCIEFRITDDTNENTNKQESQWHQTGHLITVKELISRHHYLVETRYKGDSRTSVFRVEMAPYQWQETWAIVCFVLAGLSLIALIMYVWHKKQVKKKERQIEMGIDICLKEQNRHDIHLYDNTVQTTQGLILKNQTVQASEFLGNATSIFRDKLIYGEKLLIPFDDDMKTLKKFMSNAQIQFGFRYSINIDPELKTDEIQLPSMLWQISLENSINHGISPNGGLIVIHIFKKKNDLLFTIRDNGRFIDKPTNNRKGHGMEITRNRITGLNMVFPGQKVYYDLKRADNETVVEFIFENWLT